MLSDDILKEVMKRIGDIDFKETESSITELLEYTISLKQEFDLLGINVQGLDETVNLCEELLKKDPEYLSRINQIHETIGTVKSNS